jgi:hypothetical protein
MPCSQPLPAVTPDDRSLRFRHPSRQRSGAADGGRSEKYNLLMATHRNQRPVSFDYSPIHIQDNSTRGERALLPITHLPTMPTSRRYISARHSGISDLSAPLVAESTPQNISSRVMPFSQESENGDFFQGSCLRRRYQIRKK